MLRQLLLFAVLLAFTTSSCLGHSIGTPAQTKPTKAMAHFDVDAWQRGLGRRDEPSLEGTCFESYWKRDASPLASKTLSFDGFSFKGRMAMLQYLIYDLDSPMEWEPRDDLWVHHWLWAYAAQMDWQHRSGRFVIGSSKRDKDNNDRISTKSWWGYMNFCFSVCIFLGAEQAGLIKNKIKLDRDSKALIEKDEAIRKCISSWAYFFRGPYSSFKKAVSDRSISDSQYELARFELQKEVWKAHTTVIRATVGTDVKSIDNVIMNEMLQLLPEPEQKFGLGWCRMVELLAALCFPTDLRTLFEDGGGYLPIEIVSDEKVKQWQLEASKKKLSEVDCCRLRSVENTFKLVDAPERALEVVGKFYRRVVQTPEIARSMPMTVIRTTHGSTLVKFWQVLRLIGLFLKPSIMYLKPRGKVERLMMSGILISFSLALYHGYL
jgi:hypothetical protein